MLLHLPPWVEECGMEHYEAWVVDPVQAGASIIGLYPMNEETRARYEAERSD